MTGREINSQIQSGMRHAALQRQHRIEAENHHCDDEDEVALVELNAQKRGEIAVQKDQQHAHERHQDADRLRQRQPDAEQNQRPHRDDQRPGRLQQQRVQRLGMFERPILQRVEAADAGDGQRDHDAELAADRRPVPDEMLPGKGKKEQERERPAQE
jgi:hypothetical protein